MAEVQREFVMIKPDGVARGLVGEIIRRIEAKGLKIVALEMKTLDRETAEELYAEHKDKPFFEDLVEYVTSGPVVAMVVEGGDAVKAVRNLIGATDPVEATPGSIRGDFALDIGRNVVHAADSPEAAEREIKVVFGDDLKIHEYERCDEAWLYER
ncbi:MAG: nucleoside-diphosphate kinase [Methanopyri archaeon]|nr:nucleoside-diphosphate kinase [Methanopyri archaeon]